MRPEDDTRREALRQAVAFHVGTAPQRPVSGPDVVKTAESFHTFLTPPPPEPE